jgi:uncharacterized membrane protein YdjX (TVP38/TMEM64 family)
MFLRQTPAGTFVFLMVVLPMAGVPLSLFLVLAGNKFGPATGLALAAAILPPQLAGMYFLARGPGRAIAQRILKMTGHRLPEPSKSSAVLFTAAVAFLPGLSYTLKSYGLALAGTPFWSYLGISWAVNLLLGVPFVVLGGAFVHFNSRMIIGVVVAFAAMYFGVHAIRRRAGRMINEKIESSAEEGTK